MATTGGWVEWSRVKFVVVKCIACCTLRTHSRILSFWSLFDPFTPLQVSFSFSLHIYNFSLSSLSRQRAERRKQGKAFSTSFLSLSFSGHFQSKHYLRLAFRPTRQLWSNFDKQPTWTVSLPLFLFASGVRCRPVALLLHKKQTKSSNAI